MQRKVKSDSTYIWPSVTGPGIVYMCVYVVYPVYGVQTVHAQYRLYIYRSLPPCCVAEV